MAKASQRLAELQGRLAARTAGLITRGKRPTRTTLEQQCRTILRHQHLKEVIRTTLNEDDKSNLRWEYVIDTKALDRLGETHLGKTILISNRWEWSDEWLIEAYRSQFLIEAVFKEMKDRTTGSWWPLHHWTDSTLRVHGLYCSMAHLLRSLMWRRARRAGLKISMRRMLTELNRIREVINLYAKQRKSTHPPPQTVLTRMSRLQERWVTILGLEREKNHQ
jgi:transposase